MSPRSRKFPQTAHCNLQKDSLESLADPGTVTDERTGRDVEPNHLRARIRAGDPDAFGLIFDEYARAVYNLGFRLTANWAAAEDVVSLDVPRSVAAAGQDRPGRRVPAAVAAGHRRERLPQPGPGVAPSPGGPGQDSAAARGTGLCRGTGGTPGRHGSAAPGRGGAGCASPQRTRGHRAVRLVGSGLRHGRQGAGRAGRHRAIPAVPGPPQAQEAGARRPGTRGRP